MTVGLVAGGAVVVVVVLGVVHSGMRVANFLFLTHGGCLPFSFNCLC